MLKESQVHEYWERRAADHGARTVSFGNKSLDYQSRLCEQRMKFIFPHCPRSLRTLDFGCGTGNFTDCFESYLGMDISESLLSFAKMRYPKKDFILLKQPFPLEEAMVIFKPELFFSATVLQHNSDDLVRKIFKSMAHIEQDMLFCLYENSHAIKKEHIKGRTSEDYIGFLSESYKILDSSSFTHRIHGENHSVTIAKVKPLSERKK